MCNGILFSSRCSTSICCACCAGEKVKIDVPVELRGEAAGALDGGMVEQVIHSIEIEVPLDVIPDKLHLNIKNLKIGDHLTAKDIVDLPAGATILSDDEAMIVHCVARAVEEEEVAAAEEVQLPNPKSSARARRTRRKKGEEKE